MAFKGEGKRCKENTIDDILDDEWSYDFENGIDSDEKHVDSIQWCATFSFFGAGLDVGLNHGVILMSVLIMALVVLKLVLIMALVVLTLVLMMVVFLMMVMFLMMVL